MNTELTHSPIYAEPADVKEYFPQAFTPPTGLIDTLYDILLTVRDELNKYTSSTLYCNPDILQAFYDTEDAILSAMNQINRTLYHG